MANPPDPTPEITSEPRPGSGSVSNDAKNSTSAPSTRPTPRPGMATTTTSSTTATGPGSSNSFTNSSSRPGSGLGTSRSRNSRQRRRRTNRRKPTEFFLPDGRKVLVCLPEEAEPLRRKHSDSAAAPEKEGGEGEGGAAQVEVVIHGSAEHRRFLYLTKAHHENRVSELRERLKVHHEEAEGGVHVLDEWEGLKRVIGEIRGHLERVDSSSGGSGKSVGAALKTNFGKFGYDAQLRTYGEDEEEEEEEGWEDDAPTPGAGTIIGISGKSKEKGLSRRSSFTFGGSGNGSGGGNGKGNGTGSSGDDGCDDDDDFGGDEHYTMKLFQRPVVKQYFHRGLLWRASEETEVMSFELFFDLLYVGIIAINGDHAAEEYDGHELLRFVVTFIMSWMIWSGTAQLISWFETNDVLQRVKILFLIACLLGHTTNMLRAFHEGHDTYTMLVSFYLAARFVMALSCAAAAVLVPLVRGAMIGHILHILIAGAFWIASTALPMPNRLIPIFIAIAIDLFGGMVHVAMFRYGKSHDSKMAQRFGRLFEFYPAINIEHKVERTGAFISLVLGYSVVALIFQNTAKMGFNSFIGKAILGLVQSFVFNWLYFEVDGAALKMHAIRRHANSAFLWQQAHLTFAMSFILAAAALSKMVVATDCPDAPYEALTEFYQHKSDTEVHLGLRLYYCVGLGVALFSMGLISFSHQHRQPHGACRLPKWMRLLNRAAVCVILFCLPAVHAEYLNSLQLIALTTCLSIWVLLFETYARSCRTVSFFGMGKKTGEKEKQCYTAMCTKKELEEAMKLTDDSERKVDDGGEKGTGGGTTVTEVVEVMEGHALGRGEKTAVADCT
ncbi:Bacterial low temperature requirement A protein (LtrA) domain containing protein [Rhypophila sp. PSN 637]